MVPSSARYKTSIPSMGSNIANLQQLRPVTFQLKSDPQGNLQYGLVAEEVAIVYPELVIRGESGTVDGVRYDELTPFPLNEVVQQQLRVAAQDPRLIELQQQLADLVQTDRMMQSARLKLQAREVTVAKP